jgi:pyridoxal phosphate enzyme (YggS family)
VTPSSIRPLLEDRLFAVKKQIHDACRRAGRQPEEVTLVAVTKYAGIETAAMLVELGVRDLGESRPQELWRKRAALRTDVRWHLVGHLQRNKIQRTLPLHLIHSVDRLSLLTSLEQEAVKRGTTVHVLLEVNASREPSKLGFAPETLLGLASCIKSLRQVHVLGLMTMAAPAADPDTCRPTFTLLRQLRDRLRQLVPLPHRLEHLSMGMSDDFEVAIEEGATLVRIGSALLAGLPRQPDTQ